MLNCPEVMVNLCEQPGTAWWKFTMPAGLAMATVKAVLVRLSWDESHAYQFNEYLPDYVPVSAYRGAALGQLERVSSGRGQCVLSGEAGEAFYIQVACEPDERSRLDVCWVGKSANDDFEQAAILPSTVMGDSDGLAPQAFRDADGAGWFSFAGATREAGEPLHGIYPDYEGDDPQHDLEPNTLWFEWTAPVSGEVLFQMNQLVSFSSIAVYTGTSVDALTPVERIEPWLDGYETIFGKEYHPEEELEYFRFRAVAGMTYHIAVADDFADAMQLVWMMLKPANDAFADRQAITLDENVSGLLNGSTVETGETPLVAAIPSDFDWPSEWTVSQEPQANSVWYTWANGGAEQPVTLKLTFEQAYRAGTGGDRLGYVRTALARVYTGDSLGTLQLVTTGTNSAVFIAAPNTTYTFQVAGFDPIAFWKWWRYDTFGCEAGKLNVKLQKGPWDDFFDHARVLEGESGGVVNLDLYQTYSREPGEEVLAGGQTMWLKWRAPRSGAVVFSQRGPFHGWRVGVYRGSAVDALEPVIDEQSFAADDAYQSFSFVATKGETYAIAFAAAAGGGDSITMSWRMGPANTDRSQAVELTGAYGACLFTTVGIKPTASDPVPTGWAPGLGTAWFRWMPPTGVNAMTMYTLREWDASTSPGCPFAVYGVRRGTAEMVEVAVSDNGKPVDFELDPDMNRYYIMVAKEAAYEGETMVFSWAATPVGGQMENDDIGSAWPLTTLSGGSHWVDTSSATLEPFEVEKQLPHYWLASNTVWYVMRDAPNCQLSLGTRNGNYRHRLYLYRQTGSSPEGGLELVGSCQSQSASIAGSNPYQRPPAIDWSCEMSVGLPAGTYYLALVGETRSHWEDVHGTSTYFYTTLMSGLAEVFWEVTRPDNDDRAHAQVIDSFCGSSECSNYGATFEAGEPYHDTRYNTNSVWWVAIGNGSQMTFDTAGTAFDSVLGVYRAVGDGLEAIEVVDLAGRGEAETVTFVSQFGESYYIVVAGANYKGNVGEGAIRLNWSLQPANDDFAQAIKIEGTAGQTGGVNYYATFEAGEPYNESSSGGEVAVVPERTVWWKWICPQTGCYRFDHLAHSADGADVVSSCIGIYTGVAVNALTRAATTPVKGSTSFEREIYRDNARTGAVQLA